EDSLRLLADSEQASAPGIYLWAVPLGTNYLVNYVGIACTSIASRHDDHLRSYLSGQYVIYDPNAFRLGKREPVFSPVEGLRTFLRDLERNTKALVAQLRTCRVFFAPLHADRETLECLESALITA